MTYIDIWREWSPLLWDGLKVSLELAAVGTSVALLIGLGIAVLRTSPIAPLRVLARIYVDVIRGTPEILQIFIIYFGLAEYGVQLTAFVAGAVWLAIAGGAYVSEIYRAGLQAVDRGQVEAANALGLRGLSVFRHVVLPQALLFVLPLLANFVILQIKATSIASTIGVQELMGDANKASLATYNTMPLYLLAAFFYFAICYPLSLGVRWLEKVAARRR